jgi:hypothetical protein
VDPLADALPPLTIRPPIWQMLCYRECVGPSLGSLADALPPCSFISVDALPPWLGLLSRKPLCSFFRRRGLVLRAVALPLYLLCFGVYPRLLTTVSVVCNLCYEGSLIANL